VLNIQNLVAAHIHCAPVGVTLFGPVAPGGGAVDTFSAGGAITAPDAGNRCEWADVAAVVEAMRSGNAYVNVHTDDGDDPAILELEIFLMERFEGRLRQLSRSSLPNNQSP
jgi:hypothetical protein